MDIHDRRLVVIFQRWVWFDFRRGSPLPHNSQTLRNRGVGTTTKEKVIVWDREWGRKGKSRGGEVMEGRQWNVGWTDWSKLGI